MLVVDGDDVDLDFSLVVLMLVGLAGRGGQWERQGKGRRTHYLSLRLGQEALLRGVGVLVGEE